MNRAFLIILAPALFVALLYLGMGRLLTVPVPAAVALLGIGVAAYLLRRAKGHPQAGR